MELIETKNNMNDYNNDDKSNINICKNNKKQYVTFLASSWHLRNFSLSIPWKAYVYLHRAMYYISDLVTLGYLFIKKIELIKLFSKKSFYYLLLYKNCDSILNIFRIIL